MPHLGAIVEHNDPQISFDWYYNVSKAVGPYKANLRLDVKLVQWMMKKIVEHPTAATIRPPYKPIQVDGFWGPQTSAYVRWFQGTFAYHLLKDGIVDSGRGDESTISHTTYTIVCMNQTIFDFYGGVFLATPFADRDLPNDLSVSMRQISRDAFLMFLDDGD